MFSLSVCILASLLFFLVSADDVEHVLAQKNMEGYPSDLLFESVSASQNEASMLDKSRVIELLDSPEVRAVVARSALEYSAQMLNQTGQARYLSDPGLCEYPWVSWLPWMGCDSPETKQSSGTLPLIMESSYKCY